MPQQDPVNDFLKSFNTSDRVRDVAWEAVYAAREGKIQPDELNRRLKSLPFSDHVRDQLWAMGHGESAPQRTADTTASPDAMTDRGPQPSGSGFGRLVSNAASMLDPRQAVSMFGRMAAGDPSVMFELGTAQLDQFDKARAATTTSEAVGHTAAGLLPVMGPVAASVGEQAAHDPWGAAGAGIGLIGGPAALGGGVRVGSRAARPVAQQVGRQLYQSALKPTKAVLRDVRTPPGAGPDAARQTLVDTGLREGIPVSPRGQQKAGNLIDSLNTEVEARLKSAADRGATLDPAGVEQAIREVAADFTEQINAQPEIAAVETVRQNFRTNPRVQQPIEPTPTQQQRAVADMRAGREPRAVEAEQAPGPIPILTGQRMKSNTYRGLRGKYGRELSGTIEAEKAGARNLRQQIEGQAGADVGELNAREGAVIPLEEAIADAMRRRGNYGIFGLTPVVASIPAITHGNFWPLLAAMTDRAPGVVSRSGIWINRMGNARSGRGTYAATRAATAGAQAPVLVPAIAEEDRERSPSPSAQR